MKMLVGKKAAADSRRAVFRAYLGAEEMAKVMQSSAGRLLDIGGAYGIHARYFRGRCPGLQVDVLDVQAGSEPLIYEGSYLDFKPAEQYDFLWCSHVVEHLRNPGLFFDKAYADLRDGGWLGVTVPPLKHQMTFQHVTLWNAGLLLIHLIHAGFDCSDAHVATYGYNVTVIVQKRSTGEKPKQKCLPSVERKGIYFQGEIQRVNWLTDELVVSERYAEVRVDRIKPASMKASTFLRAMDERSRSKLFYFDAVSQGIYLAG